MAVDWYRTAAWDAPARLDFEARLARARPSGRQQYLRIEALALLGVGEREVARSLLWRATEDVEDYFDTERVFAWERLADLAVEDGDLDAAERLYRRVLAEPSDSGSSGCVDISLASLLVLRGGQEDLAEAQDLLVAWNGGEPAFLPSHAFRWQVTLAELAVGSGDRHVAREAARAALELTKMGPVWPCKPAVGVVDAEASTVDWLRGLAG